MAVDKSLLKGSTTMLILTLLEEKDMYGYQMIEELSLKSNDTFALKAGTLYPLLHSLEQKGMIDTYEETVGSSKVRKYYSISKKGRGLLADKKAEWTIYSETMNRILGGHTINGTV